MSLEKAIAHGKEKRKPYRGAKKVGPTCRNHGGCPYCAQGRRHRQRRQEPAPYVQVTVWDDSGDPVTYTRP